MIVKVNTRNALNKVHEKLDKVKEKGEVSTKLEVIACMLENHTEPTIEMTQWEVEHYLMPALTT